MEFTTLVYFEVCMIDIYCITTIVRVTMEFRRNFVEKVKTIHFWRAWDL